MRKDVVVIADKKEAKYARQMVHGISKLERANAHFLTLGICQASCRYPQ